MKTSHPLKFVLSVVIVISFIVLSIIYTHLHTSSGEQDQNIVPILTSTTIIPIGPSGQPSNTDIPRPVIRRRDDEDDD